MGEEEIKLQEIPKDFFQDGEGAEFKRCTFCENDLLAGGVYLIEKFFKVNPDTGRRYTLYEYAICNSCSQKKMEAMSAESIANIQRYMAEHLDSISNVNTQESYEEKMSKCPITGESISNLSEYNVAGQFIGNKMILGAFPIAINPVVGEGMQDLLSEQTKKEFDDFMDTVKGIPPELRSLFKTKRPILV